MPRKTFYYPLILFLSLFSFNLAAQSNETSIFFDCSGDCDITYFKTKLPYLNFVFDRQTADIFVLVNGQRMGNGGELFRLKFEGQNALVGINDTLSYRAKPDISESELRDGLLGTINKGLLPYLLKTNLSERITFSVESEETDEEADNENVKKDPWNYWVYRISANGNLNGEDSYRSFRINTSVSANRITDAHKLTMSVFFNYNESVYKFDDEEFLSLSRSVGFRYLYAKSLTPKWSAGFFGNVRSNTYNNLDLTAMFIPAIEYNIYPYSESVEHTFTFRYSVGPRYNNYSKQTIYGKDDEFLWRQNLEMDFEKVKNWGSISMSLSAGNYLHDFSLHSFTMWPEIEWNVFKGLSLGFFGSISFVRDQLSIPAGEYSEEEILLRIKELESNWNYYAWTRVSYRFGSNFSNVVNPRF